MVPELDLITTEKKAESIATCIEHLYEMYNDKQYKAAYEFASKIKDKISRMRTMGLDKEGIYSPENLAFRCFEMLVFLKNYHFKNKVL